MVTRGLTRQYSCEGYLQEKPVVFEGMSVLFPLCQTNFHMDKPDIRGLEL